MDHLMDDKFWRDLEAMVKMGDTVMPRVNNASRKLGQSGTLDERIAERCEFARMGLLLAPLTESPLMIKGPAPRSNPPIPNGMMYCIGLIEKIVRKDYTPGKKCEFSKASALVEYVLRSQNYSPACLPLEACPAPPPRVLRLVSRKAFAP